MNTVQKGDAFENRTYNILNTLLEHSGLQVRLEGRNELWIVPSTASINQKVIKRFPWGDPVINDLTVEGNENQGEFLILIECKSYNHPVDRGEIAEFNTRIQDLNATKGIFVTTSRLQQGAINMANHHNIALIRVDDQDNITWNLHRIGSIDHDTYYDVCTLFYRESLGHGAIVLDGYCSFKSISDYFCHLLDITPGPIAKYIPYLTNEQIRQKARDFLCRREYTKVNDIHLLFYAINSNIIIDKDADCGNIIGEYDFLDNKVYVSCLLKDDKHRQRFTLAHELGHALLHREALKGIIKKASDLDLDDFSGSAKWEQRLELQANLFASYLLMPQKPFVNVAITIKSKLDIRLDQPFYLDRQKCNIHDSNLAITTLSNYFNVSKKAVKVRLLQEHLLVEQK